MVLFILPQTGFHHTYTPDREPDPASGLWLFLVIVFFYIRSSGFSLPAGAENLARSTSKPVSFQLSKIVDFDSQIDDPIRATFLTAKPGGTRVSLRSISTFDCISGYTGDSTLLGRVHTNRRASTINAK